MVTGVTEDPGEREAQSLPQTGHDSCMLTVKALIWSLVDMGGYHEAH